MAIHFSHWLLENMPGELSADDIPELWRNDAATMPQRFPGPGQARWESSIKFLEKSSDG
jgi:hypothetical protein